MLYIYIIGKNLLTNFQLVTEWNSDTFTIDIRNVKTLHIMSCCLAPVIFSHSVMRAMYESNAPHLSPLICGSTSIIHPTTPVLTIPRGDICHPSIGPQISHMIEYREQRPLFVVKPIYFTYFQASP